MRHLFIRTVVLALGALSFATACRHKHADTPEGTAEAVKEVIAVQKKGISALKIDSDAVKPPCQTENKKAQEALAASPGSDESVQANLDLMRCQMKVNNEARCKDKPQPCGIVTYNPPAKSGEQPPPPENVDVAVPAQITQACSVIGGAAVGLAAVPTGDPTTGVMLGSAIGEYSCGAWFKAAARSDPTLFLAPIFVPTVQMLRDLKELSGEKVDLTTETAIKNTVSGVQRSTVTIKVAGAEVPVAILPVIPVGGTPGKALDDGKKAIEDGVKKVCEFVGLC